MSVYLSFGLWVTNAKTIEPIVTKCFIKIPNIPGSDGDGGSFGSQGGGRGRGPSGGGD